MNSDFRATSRDATDYLPGGTYSTIGQNTDSSPEFLFSHANGAYVHTTDGRQLLDVMMGHGSLILGHAHPEITQAVTNQVKLGNTFTYVTQPAIDLAKMIVENIPCAEKVRFMNSGSEAIMIMTRLVRAHTGKEKILKFEGAYHGFADNLLFSTNYGSAENWLDYPMPTPDSVGIPADHSKTVLVAPWNDIDRTRQIIESNSAELASIVVEPLMRGLSSKPGFLEALRDISSDHQIPLVFDEVCTGFRLALGGAQEYYGVTPDLSIFGKGLGSGYPIGAVAGNEEIMSHLDPSSDDENRIFSLGSFHGNAISAAAGVATMKELKRAGIYQDLNSYGDNMRDALEEMFLRYDIPVQMSGAGNIVEWFFTSEAITDFKSSLESNWKLKNKISDEMRKRNIFCGAGRFSSSTVHGKTEYNFTIDAMEESLRSIRDTGNLVP